MALVSPDVLTPADLLAMHVGVLRLYDGDEVQPEPGTHEPDVAAS